MRQPLRPVWVSPVGRVDAVRSGAALCRVSRTARRSWRATSMEARRVTHAQRVKALLAKMTLKEKVGQMDPALELGMV